MPLIVIFQLVPLIETLGVINDKRAELPQPISIFGSSQSFEKLVCFINSTNNGTAAHNCCHLNCYKLDSKEHSQKA